jgi:hypothetical protein
MTVGAATKGDATSAAAMVDLAVVALNGPDR